jgi:hypothetical protein
MMHESASPRFGRRTNRANPLKGLDPSDGDPSVNDAGGVVESALTSIGRRSP